MDALQVLIWFCKEQKIMDVIFKISQLKNFRNLKTYDYGSFYEYVSFRDFVLKRVNNYGFKDIFWDLEPNHNIFNLTPLQKERYKKAKSKWNRFVKNNIIYSNEFIKVGDKVEIELPYGRNVIGTVNEIPKEFTNYIFVDRNNHDIKCPIFLTNFTKIKVNDVEKTVEYCIKRRRKIYGTSKK